MSSATVRWIGEKKFVGIDSTNHSVVLSTPDEGVGMKPSELLLVALASCTAVDVVEILNKRRVPLNSLEIQVSAEQDEDPPWTFRKILIKYLVSGEKIKDKDISTAIELSEGKYCSVAATLRGKAVITTEYEILPLNK
jgi:putative redox protein